MMWKPCMVWIGRSHFEANSGPLELDHRGHNCHRIATQYELQHNGIVEANGVSHETISAALIPELTLDLSKCEMECHMRLLRQIPFLSTGFGSEIVQQTINMWNDSV